MTISSDSPLLQIDSLSVHFSIERGLLRRKVGEVRAVDGVSLDIHPGETLGLVGESGCGKSTLGRTVVKLQSATGGEVLFDREPISEKIQTARDVQLIFQDPFSSLNPRMTLLQLVGEPLLIHRRVAGRAELRERVADLLQLVQLDPTLMDRHPHAFSGGQRQRLALARAIIRKPDLDRKSVV